MEIDLTEPHMAYLLGLLQTDGHYNKKGNKGRITLECSVRDVDIVHKLSALLSVKSTLKYRTRKTNFSENHTTFIWSIFDQEFRESFGLQHDSKSHLIAPPNGAYSEVDYWRGIIDGDGSLGISASTGGPFVSLVTASEDLKEAYLSYLENIFGYRKKASRNTRDDAYNIMINNEDAMNFAALLYYPECVCLDRKMLKAQDISNWIRVKPKAERRIPWEDWEIACLLANSLETSLTLLSHRSEKAVKIKHYRVTR